MELSEYLNEPAIMGTALVLVALEYLVAELRGKAPRETLPLIRMLTWRGAGYILALTMLASLLYLTAAVQLSPILAGAIAIGLGVAGSLLAHSYAHAGNRTMVWYRALEITIALSLGAALLHWWPW